MLIQTAKGAAAATLFAAALAVAGLAPVQAQTPSVTKQCGDKWAAAKTAGTAAGLTWPKFLSQCRAELAAQPASATTTAPAAAPAPAPATTSAPPPAPIKTAAPAAPVKPVAPATTAPVGNAVFPTAISSKYSSESAGDARKHTCLDQYNANKATNANGGLKWIQTGGGYYSECNKRLKG